MIMEIRNNNDLVNALNPVIDSVVEEMADWILDILFQYIWKDVYEDYKPYVYNRTYEFLNSWVSEVERSGRYKETIATIFNSPAKMHYDTTRYIHGSPESNDFRQHLKEAIEEGLGGNYWFPYTRRDGSINPAIIHRHFFRDTVDYLSKGQRLLKMFEKKMAEHGILITKKVTPAYISAVYMMNNSSDEG